MSTSPAHLARRFWGSLRPGGPGRSDVAWVEGVLSASELQLWRAMSGPDRRHSVRVGRSVQQELGKRAGQPVLAAALLHDVGKIDSGLRTPGRVLAGLWLLAISAAPLRARRLAERVGPSRRIGLYLRHPEIGSARLERAGSDRLTVAWAREHHLAPQRWSIAADLAGVLQAADDD